ncbi:MAG: hypothetical protein A2X97_09415 [Bdellovibrionales bacterium GWA1_52_35]|nr:MAG: hypothetical protein A2X97_09415 [Bdellovibrionales bacterium GWA1_52_35]
MKFFIVFSDEAEFSCSGFSGIGFSRKYETPLPLELGISENQYVGCGGVFETHARRKAVCQNFPVHRVVFDAGTQSDFHFRVGSVLSMERGFIEDERYR